MEFLVQVSFLLLGLGWTFGAPKVDDWKSKRLQSCCRTVNVKPQCQHLCKYDADTSELMCAAHDCYNDLQRWMYCAADTSNTDPNWNCCFQNGVDNICEAFCRGSAPKSDQIFSSSDYFQCLFGAGKILQCHADNLPVIPQHANPFRSVKPHFDDTPLPQDKLDTLSQVASGCK